ALPPPRVPVTGIFAPSFIGSVPLWLWVNAAGIGSTDAHDIDFRTAMVPGFMYVTGLSLLLRTRLGATRLSFLRLYGRMAFSNYLGPTVLCVLTLPPLASAGHISPLGGLGISAGVSGAQCALPTVWLHFFRYGPLEWLWRGGTYWELTPLRSVNASRS